MIYLQGNDGAVVGQTIVSLFLYDNCTLDIPYFTFRMINKQSKQEIIFAAVDVSADYELWNQFIFKIKESNPVLTIGEFSAYPGEYLLEVYEAAQPGELVLANCVGVIKNIIAYVIGNETEPRVIEEYPVTKKISHI